MKRINYYNKFIIIKMSSSVLEILSLNELELREENLKKQLKKVKDEIDKRKKEENKSSNIIKIKIKKIK